MQIKQVGELPEAIVVNGDSGNDVELFAVPGVKGTMVLNASSRTARMVHGNMHLQPYSRCAVQLKGLNGWASVLGSSANDHL